MDLRSTNGTRRNGQPLLPLTPTSYSRPGTDWSSARSPSCREAVARRPRPRGIELRASPPVARSAQDAFLGAHPADRWVRLRWAGETALLKVGVDWMRAAWRRASERTPDADAGLSPLEEGAAQFVLSEVVRALGERLGVPVRARWLARSRPGDALARRRSALARVRLANRRGVDRRATHGARRGGRRREAPSSLSAWAFLEWPAAVCLGQLSLRIGDLRRLDVGDALIPDSGGPEAACRRSEWTSSLDSGRGTWHGCRFRLIRGPVLSSASNRRGGLLAGGETPMSDQHVRPPSPPALGIQDLELLVTSSSTASR